MDESPIRPPPQPDDRERTIVKKISKVSILQTARKIDNEKVLTEQRLIPLTQISKFKVSEITTN